MKKYFLILVLFLFFAPAARAQTQIPDSVAVWFLQKNQERLVLEKYVVTLRKEISTLKATVATEEIEKGSYDKSVQTYKDKIQLKEDEMSHAEKQIKELKKEVRKQAVLKWIGFGVAILAVIATFLLHG